MTAGRSATGLLRIVRAVGYTSQGLRAAWRHEEAFRQELIVAVCLLPIIVLAPMDRFERLALLASLLLVLIVELLNSAIEAVVDRISPEQHELSGRAKDMGSAAAFLSQLLAAVVWIVILYPVVTGQ